MVHQICVDTLSCRDLTLEFVNKILNTLEKAGVKSITLCPASRNAFFVQELVNNSSFHLTSWYEERSAGFYTLGLVKQSRQPAVVITTSGTAAAELLPALIEAHYLQLPLIAITADRPKRFRESGAPQCIEQPDLFSCYSSYSEDLTMEDEPSFLTAWERNGPLHLNICLEDPRGELKAPTTQTPNWTLHSNPQSIDDFLESTSLPFVIVSGLAENEQEPVSQFLQRLGAPAYFEAPSGLRENPALQSIAIRNIEKIWKQPIDGVLRIGSVPTLRPWRDLDDKEGELPVLSLTSAPFPGLHWGDCCVLPLESLAEKKIPAKAFDFSQWQQLDKILTSKKDNLYKKYPSAEPSLIHSLSNIIPSQALVYLGNSLPIREWDLAASFNQPHPKVACNRGANGIDGQISTFFGMCESIVPSWGIFGDLTALYDMAAFWILNQKENHHPQIVIINNGGGQIFKRMYREEIFLNRHNIQFESLAKLWNIHYQLWKKIPNNYTAYQTSLIEIVPDENETQLFWEEVTK